MISRLLVYFGGAILVFALVLGAVFLALFANYNTELHVTDLKDRAANISQTLSGFFETGLPGEATHGPRQGQGGGFGAYMRFLDDVAMSDVWVVDSQLEQITRSHGQSTLTYRDLPAGAEATIRQALDGTTAVSRGFSDVVGRPTITVATPIITSDGQVVGAVLLHEQVELVAGVTNQVVVILLVSAAAAILITFLAASLLAGRFVKPLRRMKAVAQTVSGGDFTVRTAVRRDDEIGELATALDSMTATLAATAEENQRLDQQRRDMMSSISHELRTPVTVIRGSLEALCDGVVSEPDKVTDYHRQMLRETVFLDQLVSDVLDLARLQNPDFPLEMDTVDLNALLRDVVRSAQRVATGKQITINLAGGEADSSVWGDYRRLRQMLMIVLDNAVKYSEPGREVQVGLKRTDGRWCLLVRDQGPGIAEEDLPQVFERFQRLAPDQDSTGTGLGLSIAKQIADRHGWQIEITSQVGRGTDVRFLVPADDVDVSGDQAGRTATGEMPQKRAKKDTVLP